MFDPIKASREIKASYIDYITTTFDLADRDYAQALRSELQREGMVAKGPYLDIGGSYEAGAALSQLMAEGKTSALFRTLEPVPEKERELKLERPLYSHQERALTLASSGKNLVVTTGTGSGKTESFLLPILDHLLRQEERGELGPGVRAIIIYPMNALANDQMKRMRALLKGHPAIIFGLYNGNTEHTQARALEAYRRTLQTDPQPNEIISREEMQAAPPHILITNYSMLEYMMLRPKDDAVFRGARLRYIVLDEAHIYKGATGMETSLLMRRLRARISEPDSVQYILTSATLGGPEADGDILAFARSLCDVDFQPGGIIRSKERRPPMEEARDFPPELFRRCWGGPRLLLHDPPHPPERPGPALHRPQDLRRKGVQRIRVHHERDYRLGLRPDGGYRGEGGHLVPGRDQVRVRDAGPPPCSSFCSIKFLAATRFPKAGLW